MSSAATKRSMGSRTRSGKFVPTAASCHFLMFDCSIDRIKRVEFYLAANASVQHVQTPQVERYAELRLITDPRHPAVGSYGLFAKVRIASQTVITPYSGCVQHAQEAPLPGTETYGMGYVSHPDLVVDAEFMGNYARFANDPRNTVKTANIIAQNKLTRFGENVTVLVAKTNINAGDELLLDYGKGHVCFPKAWEDRWGKPITRARRPSLPFPGKKLSLLWQCTQCGAFNGTLPVPLATNVCSKCNQPRASHAYLIAVPKATGGEKNADDVGQKRKRNDEEGDVHSAPAVAVPGDLPPQTVEPGLPSVPAKWPMNFPYISWQIWDPEVPLSMVLELAKFKQQDNLSVCEKQDGDRHIVVYNTNSVKNGEEIAVAGGLVVPGTDKRLEMLRWRDDNSRSGSSSEVTEFGHVVETSSGPHVLAESMVVPLRSKCEAFATPKKKKVANDEDFKLCGDADEDEIASLDLHLIVTNELRHLEWETAPSAQGALLEGEAASHSQLTSDGLPLVGNSRWEIRVDAMGCVYVALVADGDLDPWQELVVSRH